MSEDTQSGGGEELSPEEMKEARDLGWADEKEWRGRPEDWIPAKEFLERGRQVLPIVTATNSRLKGQVSTLSSELARTQAELRAQRAALDALETAQEENETASLEDRRAQLKADLVAASRDGDHERVAELTDELVQLGREPEGKEPKGGRNDGGSNARGNEPHPEVVAWFTDHEEVAADPRRIALMRVVAEEKRAKGDKRVGAAFMDEVLEEVEKTHFSGRGNGAGHSRVAGDNGGRGRQNLGSGGKTYADLPAEAKQACDRMASKVVGPGKKHADIASWRKSYTSQYFQD